MTPYIQIEWLCADVAEATKVVQLLLKNQLIACANIVEGVKSYYTWKGKQEEGNEVQVFLKTHKDLFSAIQKLIKEHCLYEVPPILAFSILEANQDYLEWLDSSINRHV